MTAATCFCRACRISSRTRPPEMPRLPRKLVARRADSPHPAIQRADKLDEMWERVKLEADVVTLNFMLRLEEQEE